MASTPRTPPTDAPTIEVTATFTVREHPALSLAPSEPITSLRYFGRGVEPLALPAARARFTIGAASGDVVVPRALSSAVSAVHATIERVGGALRVRDRESCNGTYRSLRGPRTPELQIEAGAIFWLADVALVAMNERLAALRSRLAWCIGLDRHIAIDDAIEAIAEGHPIVLLGERGTDAAGLAAAIHDASAQRANRLVTTSGAALPSLANADGSTVFLDLDAVGRLPAPYVARLLDVTRAMRPIFAATSERRARLHLDTYRERARAVVLGPLALRRDEIVRLLAIHWRDELRTDRTVDELGPAILEVAGYHWPRNLDELAEHSPRLLAYLECGTVRGAARALGIKHQTLSDHFARIGFPVADPRERDAFALDARGGRS